MENQSFSYLNGNTIELHYWLKNQSHSMDAFVQNKCERELLQIIEEIAKTFNAKITIETEPLAEGGIRRWFSILPLGKDKKLIFYTVLITSLATGIITTPIGTALSVPIQKIIEKLFEDDELKNLAKEKLEAEITNLKLDAELKTQVLMQNKKIAKKRSDFYEVLNNYPKTDKITFSIENEERQPLYEEIVILRENYKDFIIQSDDLESIVDENAIIEIISPILKKGEYKWRGIYNGEALSFDMKSNEYKTLVQTGKIEFKNGSSINCLLEIKRKINSDGDVEIVGRDIIRVNEYFENDQPTETPEGKKHRQIKEADKQQLKIFE